MANAPVQIRVDDRELRAFAKKLQAAGPLVNKRFVEATTEAASFIWDFLGDYPQRSTHTTMNFVSEKQRRYVMWAIRNGVIQVPYRRTGTLGRRWRSFEQRPHVVMGGIRAVITNNVPYAHWVQDESRQAQYHRGRWPTVQMVERGAVKRKVELVFQGAIDRLVRALAGKTAV